MSGFCASIRCLAVNIRSLPHSSFSTSVAVNRINAYNLYVKTNYDAVKRENPYSDANEVMKILTDQYRNLSDAQKRDLSNNLSTSINPNIDKAKKQKLTYAYKHGMPKRSVSSGFNIFVREKMCDMKGQSVKNTAVRLQEVVKQWKALSESEHTMYNVKAQKIKDDYETQLKAWAMDHGLPYRKGSIESLASVFYDQSVIVKADKRVSTASSRKS